MKTFIGRICKLFGGKKDMPQAVEEVKGTRAVLREAARVNNMSEEDLQLFILQSQIARHKAFIDTNEASRKKNCNRSFVFRVEKNK